MSIRYEGEVELVCVCKLQFNLFAVFEVCFENKRLLLQTGETNEWISWRAAVSVSHHYAHLAVRSQDDRSFIDKDRSKKTIVI